MTNKEALQRAVSALRREYELQWDDSIASHPWGDMTTREILADVESILTREFSVNRKKGDA